MHQLDENVTKNTCRRERSCAAEPTNKLGSSRRVSSSLLAGRIRSDCTMQRVAALIMNSSRTVSFLLPSSNTAKKNETRKQWKCQWKCQWKGNANINKRDAARRSKERGVVTRAVAGNLEGGSFWGRQAAEHCAICGRGTFVAGHCRREA